MQVYVFYVFSYIADLLDTLHTYL